MIIARIHGGLGNQMFQYANGLAISIRNKSELLLDISNITSSKKEAGREFLLPKFNIIIKTADEKDFSSIRILDTKNIDLLSKIRRRISRIAEYFKPLYKRKFIIEPYFHFCPDILKIKHSCYLSGVWQSEKYFKDIEEVMRKEFILRNKPSIDAESWMGKVSGCDSVSIHIRRGDYVNSLKTSHFHGVCSLEYYDEAMALITQKIANPVFFVFSDDIEWVKENLKTSHSMFYVSDNTIPDYEELVIMSKCKHNIIANSSFSWWGAWLNENKEKIVIAPKEWFNVKTINTNDLIPKNWLII